MRAERMDSIPPSRQAHEPLFVADPRGWKFLDAAAHPFLTKSTFFEYRAAMRAIALTLLALGAAGPMSAAVAASESETLEPVHVTIYGGIGVGELIHLDVGWLVTPKWHVEWRTGNIIFNWSTGPALTYYFGSSRGPRPARRSWLMSVEARVNPELPLDLKSGGDRLGGHVGVYGGYAILRDGGLSLRALAGVILLEDEGFATGPNFRFSLGWAF